MDGGQLAGFISFVELDRLPKRAPEIDETGLLVGAEAARVLVSLNNRHQFGQRHRMLTLELGEPRAGYDRAHFDLVKAAVVLGEQAGGKLIEKVGVAEIDKALAQIDEAAVFAGQLRLRIGA